MRAALWICLLLSVVLTVPACGYRGEEQGPPAPLHDLDAVADLKLAFNAAAGAPRLILLLSPT